VAVTRRSGFPHKWDEVADVLGHEGPSFGNCAAEELAVAGSTQVIALLNRCDIVPRCTEPLGENA
jgi:hypothetical protein